MSVVIKNFRCKVTKKIYRTGDAYTGNRKNELQKLGYVKITEVEDTGKTTQIHWPKHVGGGVYELSDGERIKGKEAAISAQKKIDE